MIRLVALSLLCWFGSAVAMVAQEPKDWANFGRYSQSNAEVEKPAKVVFMGNSITELWERTDPAFFTDNDFICRGIGGQVTSQMLVRFRADVINLSPKVVVIMAGTNDVALNDYAVTPEHTYENIISMAELAQANKIKVVICSIPPAAQFGWRKEVKPVDTIHTLNMKLKEYAAKHKIPYADFYTAMVDGNGGLPQKYSLDGVHPTLEGYKVMEPILMRILNKLL